MTTSRFSLDTATGLLAGWVAARAKAQAESTLQSWGEAVLPPGPGQKELPGADPTGHGQKMPPSMLYLRLVARLGRDPQSLDKDQVEAGAVWFHRLMAYGYPVAYSLASRRVPAVRAGVGSIGGAALFGAFHGSVLPAMGVQAPVKDLPRAWWVWEGGSHVVYGITVELVIGAVRRLTR